MTIRAEVTPGERRICALPERSAAITRKHRRRCRSPCQKTAVRIVRQQVSRPQFCSSSVAPATRASSGPTHRVIEDKKVILSNEQLEPKRRGVTIRSFAGSRARPADILRRCQVPSVQQPSPRRPPVSRRHRAQACADAAGTAVAKNRQRDELGFTLSSSAVERRCSIGRFSRSEQLHQCADR